MSRAIAIDLCGLAKITDFCCNYFEVLHLYNCLLARTLYNIKCVAALLICDTNIYIACQFSSERKVVQPVPTARIHHECSTVTVCA